MPAAQVFRRARRSGTVCRSEIARRGSAGVAVSLTRPRSATACGLRATALRCSAARASARGRRR